MRRLRWLLVAASLTVPLMAAHILSWQATFVPEPASSQVVMPALKTEATVDRVAKRIVAFQMRYRRAPRGLSELVKRGLMTTVPRDGWGRHLLYRRTCKGWQLVSRGADGRMHSHDDVWREGVWR